MITSYEQFKSVTASLFNSKVKSLNEMRTIFAKSLGFGSVQALKDKLETENKQKTSFITVVEMSDGVLNGTTSFRNTADGMNKAQACLVALVKEISNLSDEELAIVEMDGSYQSGDGSINCYIMTSQIVD